MQVEMRSQLFKHAPVALIALLFAGLALPPAAPAKVTCSSRLDAKTRVLSGMPATPESGVAYETSIRTKTRYPANPYPLLMLVRCEGERDTQFMQVKPDRLGAV